MYNNAICEVYNIMSPKRRLQLIAKITKVHRVGGSLMVTLPPEFIRAHSISEGDLVGILANHVLKLDPMKEGRENEGDGDEPISDPAKV